MIDGFATISIPVGKERDFLWEKMRKRRYNAPTLEMTTELLRSRLLFHGQEIFWDNVSQTCEQALLLLLEA